MKSYNAALPIVGLSFKFVNYIPKSNNCPYLLTVLFIFISSMLFAGGIINKNAALSGNCNPTTFYEPAASPLTGTESLRTNLYLLNANNTTVLADGVLIEYNNLYHDSVYLEDAYKFTNIGENLGISRYGKVLAIERRPIITTTDTLFFKLWHTAKRNYQFGFEMVNLNHPGMEAYLEDAYLGTSAMLILNGASTINFSVNADPASANANRFRIVFKTIFPLSAPLPVTFTSVKGFLLNNKVLIEWDVENEMNVKEYEVERSMSGTDYTKLNSILVKSFTGPSGSYSLVDNNPPNGNVFYRIKCIDRDGRQKFSQIIKLAPLKTNTGSIIAYPNPVKGNMVNLQFINQPIGTYEVRMLNGQGQFIFSNRLTVGYGNISQPLYFNRELGRGIYQLQIKSPDNSIQINKIIVAE